MHECDTFLEELLLEIGLDNALEKVTFDDHWAPRVECGNQSAHPLLHVQVSYYVE